MRNLSEACFSNFPTQCGKSRDVLLRQHCVWRPCYMERQNVSFSWGGLPELAALDETAQQERTTARQAKILSCPPERVLRDTHQDYTQEEVRKAESHLDDAKVAVPGNREANATRRIAHQTLAQVPAQTKENVPMSTQLHGSIVSWIWTARSSRRTRGKAKGRGSERMLRSVPIVFPEKHSDTIYCAVTAGSSIGAGPVVGLGWRILGHCKGNTSSHPNPGPYSRRTSLPGDQDEQCCSLGSDVTSGECKRRASQDSARWQRLKDGWPVDVHLVALSWGLNVVTRRKKKSSTAQSPTGPRRKASQVAWP